ncbi:MAG: 1-acyl-sn-glycerol-3-phosphate acyltransferase [Tetrasphaera sp.]
MAKSVSPKFRRVTDATPLKSITSRVGVSSRFEVENAVVDSLKGSARFLAGLHALADRERRAVEDVVVLADEHLHELAAIHSASVTAWWEKLGSWLMRGYDLVVDVDGLQGLRTLDRDHTLVFLISHRSYLDEWVIPGAVHDAGISRMSVFAGANLDYFPMGAIARRAGMMHVRRVTAGDPVYKYVLRNYLGHLVGQGVNLMWSVEGGRTRTGKLRPPRLGLLRYVVDAVDTKDLPEVYLVPISVLYDQIPANEVRLMNFEARGGSKRPEDIRWFLDYISHLSSRLGRVYLNVGEPLPLRERLAELREEDPSGHAVVERVALDVCHRINNVTPVAATAAVCIALLGSGRALDLGEIMDTVRPLADYLDRRHWSTAGGVNLGDRATIRAALKALVDTKVVNAHESDVTVWSIAPSQHLTAANYRNSAIHVFLDAAIAEVAFMGVIRAENEPHDAYAEALRLRDLLKFEFFFARQREFALALLREIGVDPNDSEFTSMMSRDQATMYFDRIQVHLAPLLLRPFLDAYAIVAHELTKVPPSRDIEREAFLEHCLAIGEQWALRRLVASDESNSLEMFRNAYQLAEHRGLVDPDTPDLSARRTAFLDEIEEYRARLTAITERLNGERPI